ncbi:hypothetical protein, partial [Streptomyces spectabilis]|uniref:hypothetical protein n=1 Tax=Streptomyces spectabilis TaxID=68270 RepID=UPI0033F3E9E1
MNGEGKITASHRSRLAIIYLRQSTMLQVRDHTESTTRQYALAELAAIGVQGRYGRFGPGRARHRRT